MINPLRVLLFLAAGTAVAAAGAYYSGALEPYLNGKPAAVATLPADTAAPSAEVTVPDPAAPKQDRVDDKPAGQDDAMAPAASDPAPAAAAPKDQEIAAVEPQAPAMTPAPETTAPAVEQGTPAATGPTFDLVRVEADGSMVIAGKATPKAKIELLASDAVIGSGTADDGGDFVIVLDKPLGPGDYQIGIRVTNADGSVATSTQTAVVSIPKESGGQVLAMIEEPGKPSEVITVPQPAIASAAGGDQKPADQIAAVDPSKPATPPADAKPDTGTQAPATASGAAPATGDEIAAATPKPETPAAVQPAAPAIDIAVEAVEIEGDKIFVAGRAPSGSTIRAYAGEIFLGQTKASEANRFLVEAVHDLAVGSYIVRADVIGADGAEVIARAAVPFEREPGENVAAVANPPPATETGQKPADVASASAPPAPAQPAPDQAPPAGTAVAQEPATGTETPVVQPAESASPPVTAGADEPAKPIAPATDTPAVADTQAPPAATAPAVEQPAPAGTATAPAAEQPADVAAATPPAAATAAPPVDATAPPLQNVASAVIIRKRDTLWRISKRVYGRGVRYSTIYLANQDQIKDPDRIWPGQVFVVPGKTDAGETADMSKMGAQATSKTQ